MASNPKQKTPAASETMDGGCQKKPESFSKTLLKAINHLNHTCSSKKVKILYEAIAERFHRAILATNGLKLTGRVYTHLLMEISRLLNTGLDEETMAICVRLCENGVNPDALANVIRELRKESADVKAETSSKSLPDRS